MKTANMKVRLAVTEAGLKYSDLADTMNLSRSALSLLLSTERSEAMQDEILVYVRQTADRQKEKAGNELVQV